MDLFLEFLNIFNPKNLSNEEWIWVGIATYVVSMVLVLSFHSVTNPTLYKIRAFTPVLNTVTTLLLLLKIL